MKRQRDAGNLDNFLLSGYFAFRFLILAEAFSVFTFELLELLSVPRSMLPKVVPSSGIMGHMHPEFLGHSLPLAGDAGDQQAATYGNACMLPGMAKNTYGTGCFLLMNTGTEARRSENNLLTTVGWNCGYGLRYALEGSVFIAGAVEQDGA